MSILAIDWGRKRIGIAHDSGKNDIVFPVGALDNTPDMTYDLAHIIVERKVNTIVVGYPREEGYIRRSIDGFIVSLSMVIDPAIQIVKENEDFTSVQAGERLGNFKKTAAEDSMAAVLILERYKQRILGST